MHMIYPLRRVPGTNQCSTADHVQSMDIKYDVGAVSLVLFQLAISLFYEYLFNIETSN